MPSRVAAPSNGNDVTFHRQILLIAGYFRESNCTLPSYLDPVIVYHVIREYYKKPSLMDIIKQELNKKYNTELSNHFISIIQQLQWQCRSIYLDITRKNLKSKIINELSSNQDDLNMYELHDELRGICYGRRISHFNSNSSQYFHYIQELSIEYIKADNSNGHKIDFSIIIPDMTRQIKLEILVYIYLFAYHWMYIHQSNKRCKLDICLHQNIQYIFGNVDVMIVPHDLCREFIEDIRVNKSCYFVRNVLNQYLKNTFVPLTTECESIY